MSAASGQPIRSGTLVGREWIEWVGNLLRAIAWARLLG